MSGIWEIFMPELGSGTIYKFEIRSRSGPLPFLKADPYGREAELRPKTGSIVAALEDYQWNDAHWMNERPRRDWFAGPISIYEVHLGSWWRPAQNYFYTYDQIADWLIPYVKDLGYTSKPSPAANSPA